MHKVKKGNNFNTCLHQYCSVVCGHPTARIGIGSTISKRSTYFLLLHMFLWSPRRLQCPTGILCQQYPQRWPERRRNWSDATALCSRKQALSDSNWWIDNHYENPFLGFAFGMVTWLDQVLSLKTPTRVKSPRREDRGGRVRNEPLA